MELVIDKRKHKHCPSCKKENLFFKLSPLPSMRYLIFVCSDCGFEIQAKREEDKQEFKELAKEFR